MQRFIALGQAIQGLRATAGLSMDAFAVRVGLSTAVLISAEEGDLDLHVASQIAGTLGIDQRSLTDDGFVVVDKSDKPSGSIFLLHGPLQDFRASDAPVFARALAAARQWTVTGNILSRATRFQCSPVEVAGPQPYQAALQGYQLARRVRSMLKLGGEPIEDLRALIEEQIGFVVVTADFATTALRAASVLDQERAAGAVVLRARELKATGTKVRVWLAHELCHLLFDIERPDTVQIALDDDSDGGSIALRESRAKGFAAEFLLPRQGLCSLLGAAQAPTRDRSAATAMVHKARTHFGTPRELTIYHLANCEFIDRWLMQELIADPGERSVHGNEPWNMREQLPAPNERPVCLGVGEVPLETLGVPTYVAEARREASAMEQQLGTADHARMLGEAYALDREQKYLAATDKIAFELDALFLQAAFVRAGALLDMIDPRQLHPEVLIPVLSVARDGRSKLDGAYERASESAFNTLRDQWALDAQRLQKLERMLA